MVHQFVHFKLPEVHKSYLPTMVTLAKWSLNSCCIPIRLGSIKGEFNLLQNLRQKIIYYLSFSAYLLYVLTFDFWFYKNFFGQSHPVWENLVLRCFSIGINIAGIFQIVLSFRKNELKQLLENSFLMEKRCFASGNGNLCLFSQHVIHTVVKNRFT